MFVAVAGIDQVHIGFGLFVGLVPVTGGGSGAVRSMVTVLNPDGDQLPSVLTACT